MNVNKKVLGWVLAVPLTAAISFGVWALDQRYLTIASYEEITKQQRIDRLGDRIDELTLKESLGLASEYEKAILKQLKEKIAR